jgi:hypothetical protein
MQEGQPVATLDQRQGRPVETPSLQVPECLTTAIRIPEHEPGHTTGVGGATVEVDQHLVTVDLEIENREVLKHDKSVGHRPVSPQLDVQNATYRSDTEGAGFK